MSKTRGYQDLEVVTDNDGRAVRIGVQTRTHRVGLALEIAGAAAMATMVKKNEELPDREINLIGCLHISEQTAILAEKWPEQVTLRMQFEHEPQAVVWSVRDVAHRKGFIMKMPFRALNGLFHAIEQPGKIQFQMSGNMEVTA